MKVFKTTLIGTLLPAFMALASSAWAQDDGSSAEVEKSESIEADQTDPKKRNLEDEVAGIIVDRTITIIGQQFYTEFNSFWRLNYPKNQLTFAIFERPTARFGSEIWVDYRGEIIFRLFVSPRRSELKEKAQAVAENVQARLSKIRLTELLNNDVDIAGDEI